MGTNSEAISQEQNPTEDIFPNQKDNRTLIMLVYKQFSILQHLQILTWQRHQLHAKSIIK